jgi:hypothetical protein
MKESFQYKDGSVDLLCDGMNGDDECEEATNMHPDGSVEEEGWSKSTGLVLGDDHYCPRCTKQMQEDWPNLQPLPVRDQ